MKSLLDSKKEISVIEVFFASLIGVALAIILVFVINNKWIYKIANHFNISNKHGEDDIWDFTLGSNDVEWITIRDFETKLVFQGAVSSFSQKDDKRELLLTDVIVYKDEDNGTLRELYNKNFIYFSYDVNANIIIEID